MGFLKTFLSAVLISVMFSSCSTDVDIYADYKDISVVYGLLDNSNDTTWIKVTRAFAGPGNALVIAKEADSSNYAHKLHVNLVGIQNGVEKQNIVFDTITINNKKAGDTIFYYPQQLVYYTTEELNSDYKYNLKIDRGDSEISSETGLVEDFFIDTPNRFINFMSDKDIIWHSAANGKRYEVTLVFNYLELPSGTTDTLHKSINWYLGMRKASNTNGGEKLYLGYSGDVFYSILENQLDPLLNVKRWTGKVDVIVACASQEFDTYLEVNQGSNNLLSEVPIYSNINGGTGLFASRKTILKSSKLSSRSESKLIQEYPELGFLPKSE
jgi:hypothetical protein